MTAVGHAIGAPGEEEVDDSCRKAQVTVGNALQWPRPLTGSILLVQSRPYVTAGIVPIHRTNDTGRTKTKSVQASCNEASWRKIPVGCY